MVRPSELARRPSAPRRFEVIVTCEHASNVVPPEYAPLFADHLARLPTHHGWDLGALEVAEVVAGRLGAPLFAGEVTRLLVDLNRSADNPTLFSLATRDLPARERLELLQRHYLPHRQRVFRAVDAAAQRGPVLHTAMHSFTPILFGKVREVDLGLLFHPERPTEVAIAEAMARSLALSEPGLRVRMNEPYQGKTDGLSRPMRMEYPDPRFASVEVELNQKHWAHPQRWARLAEHLADAIAEATA